MKKKKEILIVGTGPSGLSAALQLAMSGYKIILIEKAKTPGGLMRNIKYEGFNIDFGRKELYSRIQQVNDFWEKLLQNDYLPYDYRVGVLYENRIIEESASYRGPLRGVSFGQFLKCLVSFAKEKISHRKVFNYRDFAYKNKGIVFTEMFSKGFSEKFDGRLWETLPPPDTTDIETQNFSTTSLIQKFFSKKSTRKTSQAMWRHPRYGSGQITERILEELHKLNVEIHYQSSLSAAQIIENRIASVTIESEGIEKELNPLYVVSSIPLECAGEIFLGSDCLENRKKIGIKRGTILIYLFLDEPPKFKHCWLNVSDPKNKIGRIVNYANFGGDMVPEGKTCLCLEYFLSTDDPLFDLPDEELFELALTELAKAHLINRKNLKHHKIFKFPNTNAAVSWKDYSNDSYEAELHEKLKEVKNLYNVNRGGTDCATHAGLEAAIAIDLGNKDRFEHRTNPKIEDPWDN